MKRERGGNENEEGTSKTLVGGNAFIKALSSILFVALAVSAPSQSHSLNPTQDFPLSLAASFSVPPMEFWGTPL